jgi:hypothetical protein
MDFFLKYFFTQEVDLEFTKDDEKDEYVYVPDIAEIADNLKSCFNVGIVLFRKEKKFPRILPLCLKLTSSNTILTLCQKSHLCLLRWR